MEGRRKPQQTVRGYLSRSTKRVGMLATPIPGGTHQRNRKQGRGGVGRRVEGKENSEGVGLRWELSSERMEAGRGEIFGDEMGSGGLRLIAEKKPAGPCAEKRVKRSKE